jgi:hypothetical protein
MSGERIADLEAVVAYAARRHGPGGPATLEARMRLAWHTGSASVMRTPWPNCGR